jgi:hypothetical protein
MFVILSEAKNPRISLLLLSVLISPARANPYHHVSSLPSQPVIE